jgi:hypothetical protein
LYHETFCVIPIDLIYALDLCIYLVVSTIMQKTPAL